MLQADKRQVAPGEEVTVTITAHYYTISPALLFIEAGANAFRLKVLFPAGFVQTGGTYTDYIGTELSAIKPTVTYTIKGHFEGGTGNADFRLLRGSSIADANSLFVEKAHLTISTKPTSSITQTKSARSTGCDYIEGQYLFTFYSEAMYAHYYNGILFAAYQDGNNFKPRHWLTATGQMGNQPANCFAEDDPHTSPPNNPNPTPTGNCSYTEGQYLFTFYSEAMYAHFYNGILFAAYQDGSGFKPRHWLTATGQMSDATAGCFAEDDPHSSPPNNPNPSSGCGTGSGLRGFYTNSSDLSYGLVATRQDAQINFTWGDSPISGVVNADGFSIRWFGQVEAPVSGNYTFKTNNDDGTRLWINGQLLINDWNGHGPTWQQGSIYLNAGQKYDIVMDYFDGGGEHRHNSIGNTLVKDYK